MELTNYKPNYKYNLEFQKKILAICCRNISFLREYRSCFKTSYFCRDLQDIARIILTLFDKSSSIISRETLLVFINENNIELSDKDLIEDLYTMDLSDDIPIKDVIIDFAKEASIKTGIYQAAQIFEEENSIDKIYKILQESMWVGTPSSPGIEFFKCLPNEILSGTEYDGVFMKTGFHSLDVKINNLRPGDIFVVLATSGKGKSIFLMNIGFHNLSESGDVYHFTIGDLREDDVYTRYMARMIGIDINLITKDPKNPEILKNLERYKKDVCPGNLLIKYLPPGSCTVADIKSLCTSYRAKLGKNPRAIIVDYPDELVAHRKTGSSYEDMGEIYSDLKSLGYEMNCFVAIASQINRSGFGKAINGEELDIDNISDSMKKCYKADTIVSLTQTKEERNLDPNGYSTIRLFLAKVRRGLDQQTLFFKVNKSLMKFISM